MFDFEISPQVSAIAALAGLAICLIGQLWMLVVAAQRSAGWFFAILLLPITAFALPSKEQRARSPLIMIIAGIALFAGGLLGLDLNKLQAMNAEEKVYHVVDLARGNASSQKTLSERQSRIRTWQKELEQKKATLSPTDVTAQAAFHKEMSEYLLELQAVKDEMAKKKR